MSLYTDILASGPLAYWPLYRSVEDASGNNRPLTGSGSPVWGGGLLTGERYPAVRLIGEAEVITPNVKIPNANLPGAVAVEGFFKTHTAGSWRAVIGLNQPLSGNVGRYFILYSFDLGFYLKNNNVNMPALPISVDSLMGSTHHYVVQYEEATGTTRVYIDGTVVPEWDAAGNVFAAQPSAYMMPGGFINNGYSTTNSVTAHVAVYDRPLSPVEISSRQAYRDELPPVPACVTAAISWANSETREQAWPGEIAVRPATKQVPALIWRETEPVLPVDAKLTLGFIRGVTSLQGAPQVNKRVVCFDASMLPVAECNTDASGEFRFDLLWKHKLYTIMAMDSGSFTYSPAAADRRQPESYS